MRIIFLLPLVFLAGCAASMHQPSNDEERLDQDSRFKGVLYNTSPRATNHLPKAIPSFRKAYDSRGGETPIEAVPQKEQ